MIEDVAAAALIRWVKISACGSSADFDDDDECIRDGVS